MADSPDVLRGTLDLLILKTLVASPMHGWKRVVEHDLDAEIRHHLELETEANLRRGWSPAEARRRARIAFGGVEQVKEEYRDGRGGRWLEELLADLRYAVRGLRRAPAI